LLADRDAARQVQLQEARAGAPCRPSGLGMNHLVTDGLYRAARQTMLQDLEKNRHLPVGSSQASRINTGYGPRYDRDFC
jgi:hypothetical protein